MIKRNSLLSKFDDISKRFMEAKIAQGLESGQMGERFTLIDAARFPENRFDRIVWQSPLSALFLVPG